MNFFKRTIYPIPYNVVQRRTPSADRFRSGSRPAVQQVMKNSPNCLTTALLSLLLTVPAIGSASAAPPYEEGATVVVTGVVTDRGGLPQSNIRVVLEASRNMFRFKVFSGKKREPARLASITNSKGEYSIDWKWHDYYNHFELVVGIMMRVDQEDNFEELSREDLSRRMLQGTPVVSTVAINDMSLVTRVREFLAEVDSPEEKQVYADMGQPDRLDQAGQPHYQETTWWYFDKGFAYRFRDGTLQEVVHFAPVPPF